eukprot:9503834-Pyramimonas_sp.AAC.2
MTSLHICDPQIVYNKLRDLGVLEEVTSFWSQRVRFSDAALNHRSTIINMKCVLGLIHDCTISKEMIAVVCKEALKFCVPTTTDVDCDDATATSAIPTIPWIFDRSGDEVQDKMKWLLTPMAETKTFKKLAAIKHSLSSKAGADKQAELEEKRVAAAEAEEEVEALK